MDIGPALLGLHQGNRFVLALDKDVLNADQITNIRQGIERAYRQLFKEDLQIELMRNSINDPSVLVTVLSKK